jgi:hypothetical protein
VKNNELKVALVVDWLTVYGGAERVVEQIIECYPNCDIYSLIDFLNEEQRFFVKGKKAIQANASHPASELAGEFTFTVLAYPNTKLSETEKQLRETIEEFLKRGISEEDIKRAVAQHESSTIFGLESVNGKVSQLAAYQTFTGDAGYVTKDLERYNKVTKADVMRVFEKYIKGKHALIMSVYPKGQSAIIAAADNFLIHFRRGLDALPFLDQRLLAARHRPFRPPDCEPCPCGHHRRGGQTAGDRQHSLGTSSHPRGCRYNFPR